MKSFTEVLEEAAGKGLTVFDIDDTLFRTAAKVKVRNKKTGDVKELPPVQFNKYKLKKDEEWDFGEFKNSKIIIVQTRTMFRTFKIVHITTPLCSRNFQNVKLRLDFVEI